MAHLNDAISLKKLSNYRTFEMFWAIYLQIEIDMNGARLCTLHTICIRLYTHETIGICHISKISGWHVNVVWTVYSCRFFFRGRLNVASWTMKMDQLLLLSRALALVMGGAVDTSGIIPKFTFVKSRYWQAIEIACQ